MPGPFFIQNSHHNRYVVSLKSRCTGPLLHQRLRRCRLLRWLVRAWRWFCSRHSGMPSPSHR